MVMVFNPFLIFMSIVMPMNPLISRATTAAGEVQNAGKHHVLFVR